ncbi:MAG TPA: hypothetical protein G4O04_05105 [Anaerolineae bacterium]|nr:hypothetical protein [Anaerolineae bacterium]HID84926.1 hypothetical protein [Anaerolineales bacterium]
MTGLWAVALLWIGAGGVGLIYGTRRHRRGAWWLSALVALLAFFVGGGLGAPARPVGWAFPWQGAGLGGGGPEWVVSAENWPWFLLALSLPAAALLSVVGYAAERPHGRIWAGVLALGGVVSLGALAGNPLTLLWVWVLLDGVALTAALIDSRAEKHSQAVAVAWGRSVGWLGLLGSLFVPASTAAALLTFAVMWRLVWQLWDVTADQVQGALRGSGGLLRRSQILLTLMALRFWPSGVEGVALGFIGALALVGALVVAFGPPPRAGDGVGMALGAWAVWAAAQGQRDALVALAALAIMWGVLADAGAGGGWLTWPAWGVLLASLALLPGSPGGAVRALWLRLGPSARMALFGAWLLLGVGVGRHLWRANRQGRGTALPVGAQGAYLLGLALPGVAALRWSLSLRNGGLVGWAWLALALGAGVWFGVRRWRQRWPVASEPGPWRRGSQRAHQALADTLWSLYRGLQRSIAFITALMEGEGGVLWAMVLLGGLIIWMTRGAR